MKRPSVLLSTSPRVPGIRPGGTRAHSGRPGKAHANAEVAIGAGPRVRFAPERMVECPGARPLAAVPLDTHDPRRSEMHTPLAARAATLLAALLALTCASPAVAATTTITTTLYNAASTSEDIAESCTSVSVAESTGVLSASCNKKDTGGDIVSNATTIDLDTVVYCLVNSSDPSRDVVIVWGTVTSSYEPSAWSVSVSSTGYDYHGFATCKTPEDTGQPQSGLSLSDTMKGLKNDGGVLKGR